MDHLSTSAGVWPQQSSIHAWIPKCIKSYWINPLVVSMGLFIYNFVSFCTVEYVGRILAFCKWCHIYSQKLEGYVWVFLIRLSGYDAGTWHCFVCSKETERIGNKIGEREWATLVWAQVECDGKSISLSMYTQQYKVTVSIIEMMCVLLDIEQACD